MVGNTPCAVLFRFLLLAHICRAYLYRSNKLNWTEPLCKNQRRLCTSNFQLVWWKICCPVLQLIGDWNFFFFNNNKKDHWFAALWTLIWSVLRTKVLLTEMIVNGQMENKLRTCHPPKAEVAPLSFTGTCHSLLNRSIWTICRFLALLL